MPRDPNTVTIMVDVFAEKDGWPLYFRPDFPLSVGSVSVSKDHPLPLEIEPGGTYELGSQDGGTMSFNVYSGSIQERFIRSIFVAETVAEFGAIIRKLVLELGFDPPDEYEEDDDYWILGEGWELIEQPGQNT